MSFDTFREYYGLIDEFGLPNYEMVGQLVNILAESGVLGTTRYSVGVNGLGDGNGNIIPGTEEYHLYLDNQTNEGLFLSQSSLKTTDQASSTQISSGPSWFNYVAAELTIWSSATTIAVNSPKPRYTGPKSWASQVKSGAKFGRRLGYLGLALTVTDMTINGVNTSNTLDATFGVISFLGVPGAVIGGAYFFGNFATEAITGKTIGQHVDDNFYIVPAGLPNIPFIVIPNNSL